MIPKGLRTKSGNETKEKKTKGAGPDNRENRCISPFYDSPPPQHQGSPSGEGLGERKKKDWNLERVCFFGARLDTRTLSFLDPLESGSIYSTYLIQPPKPYPLFPVLRNCLLAGLLLLA